jgi:hypothetical protein
MEKVEVYSWNLPFGCWRLERSGALHVLPAVNPKSLSWPRAAAKLRATGAYRFSRGFAGLIGGASRRQTARICFPSIDHAHKMVCSILNHGQFSPSRLSWLGPRPSCSSYEGSISLSCPHWHSFDSSTPHRMAVHPIIIPSRPAPKRRPGRFSCPRTGLICKAIWDCPVTRQVGFVLPQRTTNGQQGQSHVPDLEQDCFHLHSPSDSLR